jgi:hypothetical protein
LQVAAGWLLQVAGCCGLQPVSALADSCMHASRPEFFCPFSIPKLF